MNIDATKVDKSQIDTAAVGRVKELAGTVTALSSKDVLRVLKVGDYLYLDDVIVGGSDMDVIKG